jgi:hypothetical protein
MGWLPIGGLLMRGALVCVVVVVVVVVLGLWLNIGVFKLVVVEVDVLVGLSRILLVECVVL